MDFMKDEMDPVALLGFSDMIGNLEEPCTTVMEELGDVWDTSQPAFEFAIETIAMDPFAAAASTAVVQPIPAEAFPRIDLPRVPTTLHAFEHLNGRYPGPHNFGLAFDNDFPEKKSKSKLASWAYSAVADRLFVNMGCPVPCMFKVDTSLPEGTILRASPRYTQPEHRKINVIRCPNHQQQDNNGSDAPPDHILRLKNKSVKYCLDPVCGRHSLTIPFDKLDLVPGAQPDLTRCGLFLLMCFSSCPGGLHRRPFEVVFTLEKDGRILGSASIDVRICACPGRDRRAAEDRAVKRTGGTSSPLPPPSPMKTGGTGASAPAAAAAAAGGNGALVAPQVIQQSTFSTFELETGARKPNDSQVYEIKVRGRGNFRLVKQIVDGLHVLDTNAPGGADALPAAAPAPAAGGAGVARKTKHSSPKKVTMDPELGGDTEPESEGEDAPAASGSAAAMPPPAKRVSVMGGAEPDFSFLSRTKLAESVHEWLKALRLEQYHGRFVDAGYDDLEVLVDLDEGDLDHVGVTLPGHRKKLLLARAALAKAFTQSTKAGGLPDLKSRPSFSVSRHHFASQKSTPRS